MVTFLGNPVSFTGKQLQVGDKALDFSLTTTDLSKKSLADFDGKKKVLSVVPSIDTGICSTQTRRFNQELAEMDIGDPQNRYSKCILIKRYLPPLSVEELAFFF